MWKSCLLINVGDNPDRPRPGRTWLRNLYHVHRRLCMAFPSDPRKDRDPLFLAPFDPGDFDGQRAHGVERDGNRGFLFRIDPQPGGRGMMVVQSASKPDWDYAFGLDDGRVNDRGQPLGNAGHLLAAPPHTEAFDPHYDVGQPLRFRIRVSLSTKKKVSADGHDLRKYKETKDRFDRQKSQSKRVALTWDKGQDPQDVIREWFARKGQEGGFEIDPKTFRSLQIGWGNGVKPNGKSAGKESDSAQHRMKFRSALLEGTLTVKDAARFRETIMRGMGSGKAFGFGLLSVAPCTPPPAVSP